MLGKDHLEISLMFSFPFIFYSIICVPHFDLSIYSVIVFSICVIIGSLLPDADCNASTLYYKHQPVYLLMQPIYKLLLWLVKVLVKRYPKTLYSAEEEHRGILHSLFGVFFSSFILSLCLFCFTLILWYTEIFSLTTVFYIFILGFVGFLSGQILHLIEDSCTKSGIKWFLPLSNKRIRGEISTLSEKNVVFGDIRPRYFAKKFRETGAIASLLIILIWAFEPDYFIYSISVPIFTQGLMLIYMYSKSQDKLEGSRWYQNISEWKKKEKPKEKKKS
jgi:membrane-bound metal-dependent hydrolase YbcI (DUF457 family)